ncbi:MAG TPA: hypothetical protein VN622_16790 [Clostridia bacterium]|nr:hypothetical protein [Clostridia bacterium]
MSHDSRDVLAVLRYELNFLEQGGYERLRHSRQAASPFKGSLTCLNHGQPLRPHACHECFLYEFVPTASQVEDVPCEHIPLKSSGQTIADFLKSEQFEELENALKEWLQSTIAQLEEQPSRRVS